MKKTKIAALAFLLGAFALISFTTNKAVTEPSAGAAPSTIIFGTKSRPNTTGTGCAGSKGICLIIKASLYDGGPVGTDMAVGIWNVTGPANIHIAVTKQNAVFPAPQPTFTVLSPYALDSEVAQSLGYNSVVLQPGEYPVTYSNQFPLGEVDVRAALH